MADTIRSSREFVGDVQDEMKKVTWPDGPQLKSSTGVIVAFVVIVSLVLFTMDYVLNGALELVRSLLGS